jgi:hypothetical protein
MIFFSCFRSTEQDGLDEISANPFTFGKSDDDNETLSDKEKLVKIFDSLVRYMNILLHNY